MFFDRLVAAIYHLAKRMREMTQATDRLTASVDNMAAAVTAAAAEIAKEAAALRDANASDPVVIAQADRLDAIAKNLTDSITAAETPATPAPTPAPETPAA